MAQAVRFYRHGVLEYAFSNGIEMIEMEDCSCIVAFAFINYSCTREAG